MEQVGRNPLTAALKTAGLPPTRGGHTMMCRQTLTPMMRTDLHNRRMLRVADTARQTLAALADGYKWAIRSGGERAAEPERGAARSLIEALECLTDSISQANVAAISYETNAVNVNGVPYMSAVSRG